METIPTLTPCLLLTLFIHFTFISAQPPLPAPAPSPSPSPPAPTPPAPAPGPAAPPNIITILKKAGRFTTLLRLLKNTQSADRINKQLSTTTSGGGGITIFAPNDDAFSNLILNAYSSEQQSELVQFHTLPLFLPLSQFETVSNPMSTEAGGSGYGQFPLNVTASGGGVNITSGFSNASVSSTVYSDGLLAVYEVDRVLLPQRFFISPPPAAEPAPAPANYKKRGAGLSATTSSADLLKHARFLVVALAVPWLFG